MKRRRYSSSAVTNIVVGCLICLSISYKARSKPRYIMSLEVDGRSGGVPMPHQHESEGFKYMNGQDTYYNPFRTQDRYITGTAGEDSQHQQPSKPEESGQGGKLRVRPGSIFRWWSLFILLAVLAVVVAGVVGSVAAKRRKNLDTWYVFAFKSLGRPVTSMLTARLQYAYTAGTQRDA